ncbi:hypothetical protein [Exiguobacterium indicum]|nr:hypothetical protein [Exiguobacterium indicum]
MGKNKDEIPYYMMNVPFFFLTALLAPVADYLYCSIGISSLHK